MPEPIWIVTGANRGLGLEFARQLHERGESVVATARRPDEADELQAVGAELHRLDVSDPDSVAAFAGAIGERPVGVLINNAGIGVRSRPFRETDLDGLSRFFEVNTIGPLRVTRALLDNLQGTPRARVVNVTSRMGSIDDNGSGGAYGYRASKAALNMATRSLAIDLADDGIVCIVLHPGWVQTDMGGERAPVRPPESIRGMLSVIDGLEGGDSGQFYDFKGRRVPW